LCFTAPEIVNVISMKHACCIYAPGKKCQEMKMVVMAGCSAR
jgi:hypothetical protein